MLIDKILRDKLGGKNNKPILFLNHMESVVYIKALDNFCILK